MFFHLELITQVAGTSISLSGFCISTMLEECAAADWKPIVATASLLEFPKLTNAHEFQCRIL